jgi:hypothetical protein
MKIFADCNCIFSSSDEKPSIFSAKTDRGYSIKTSLGFLHHVTQLCITACVANAKMMLVCKPLACLQVKLKIDS